MRISNLKLYNFRNYLKANLVLSEGVNLFIGKNAQGKTNLIEAVSIISSGKSLRGASSGELLNWSEKESSIKAEVLDQDQNFSITLALNSEGRRFYLNDNRVKSLSSIIGRLLTVSFTPKDLALIHGNPQERRGFLDKLTIQIFPQAFDDYLVYNKSLQHKKSTLKQKNISLNELTPWTKILADKAYQICNWRLKTLSVLSNKTAEIYSLFAPEGEFVEIEYQTEIESISKSKISDLKQVDFLELFLNAQNKELFQRRVAIGPHKDDLIFALNQKKSRAFASQGQARSLVLASLLASVEIIEAERKTSPVILLDDVNSELDAERSAKFFNYLFSKKRQTLITGTEVSLGFLRSKADSAFEIISGQINSLNH